MSENKRNDLDECDEDIAKLYLKMAANQVRKMPSAARAKSLASLQRMAHKLAGPSAFLGLKALVVLLRDLEQASEREQSREAGRLVGLVKVEFDQILRYRASRAAQTRMSHPKPAASLPIQKNRSKVFIVDDHPLMREGLARLINLQPDLSVCGEASTQHQALQAISELKPHIVMLDLTLAGSDGLDLIKNMKLRSLKSQVLVLSMHDESLYAERALLAGAKGYIMKGEAPEETLKAIRRIVGGEIYLSEKMASKMLQKVAGGKVDVNSRPEGSLSDRELQVFQSIGRGQGTRQIAEELHISPKTVESYRAHIKVKMNLKNAHELTQHAVHWVESNHLN